MQAVERYRRVFGPLEHNVTIGSVEFVLVDAQALDGSGDVAARSWNFVKQKAKEMKNHVRILVTHIPLFRPDDTPCGSNRASRVINQRMNRQGYAPFQITYQDYLTEKSSSKLLDSLKPVMVLSGHDHDQCFVLHKSNQGFIPEVPCKSILSCITHCTHSSCTTHLWSSQCLQSCSGHH